MCVHPLTHPLSRFVWLTACVFNRPSFQEILNEFVRLMDVYSNA